MLPPNTETTTEPNRKFEESISTEWARRIVRGISSVGTKRRDAISIENSRATAGLAYHQRPFIIRISGSARAVHIVALSIWSGSIHAGSWRSA